MFYRRAVLSNTDISSSSPSSWQQAFLNDYWGTPLKDSGSHGSYRPLAVITFKLNYVFGGYLPFGYHLVNVLMHCLATDLVVKLARHFLSSAMSVLATGALFAVHPIHTEAVAGVVGRADIAAGIFYLIAFLTYTKHISWRQPQLNHSHLVVSNSSKCSCSSLSTSPATGNNEKQWFFLGLTIVMSVVALLFKETAVTSLIACAVFDIVRGMCGFYDKVGWVFPFWFTIILFQKS